jgi:hypothetical protein
MRIIGGRDYYDSALAYGHDDTVVLVRDDKRFITGKESAAFGLATPRLIHINSGYKADRYYSERAIGVVVAGKLYQGLNVWITTRPTGLNGYHRPSDILLEEVLWLDEGAARLHEIVEQFDLQPAPARYYHWLKLKVEPIDEYFVPRQVSREAYDYLVKERISIMLTEQDSTGEMGWRVNCDGLKDVGFPKVVDPYTLFQELDMWVSGVLGMPANPTVTVSNDIKIAKHGFDRFSFRKPKQSG